MADVIGPQNYSQILRRENEGGTPMSQSSMAGGTNWSGIQGGDYADAQMAPGGQFSEQANMDARAFNSIMAAGGKYVKNKVDKAQEEAYMRGLQAAANGKAIEDLESEKVKTGLWDRLVPDSVLRQGYNDYMVVTQVEKVQAKIMADKAFAEMNPDQMNSRVVNDIAALKTDDENFNATLLQYSTPAMSTLFRRHAVAHQEYLVNKQADARFAATDAIAQSAATALEGVTADNAEEVYAEQSVQVLGSLVKGPDETYEQHETRIAGQMMKDAENGNLLLFTALDKSGQLSTMPASIQKNFYKLRDSARNAAAAKYIDKNPTEYSTTIDKINITKDLEEQVRIAKEYNARAGMRSGDPELEIIDIAKLEVTGRANIRVSQEAVAKSQQAASEARYKDDAGLKVLQLMDQVASGEITIEEGLKQRQKIIDDGVAAGFSPHGYIDPAQFITGVSRQDREKLEQASKAAKQQAEIQVAQEERAAAVSELGLRLSAGRNSPNSPLDLSLTVAEKVDGVNTGLANFREPTKVELLGAVRLNQQKILEDAQKLGKSERETAAYIHSETAKLAVQLKNSNAPDSLINDTLRATVFNETITAITKGGQLTTQEFLNVKEMLDVYKGIPGGEAVVQSVIGSKNYERFGLIDSKVKVALSMGKNPDFQEILRKVDIETAGKDYEYPKATGDDTTAVLEGLKEQGFKGSDGEYEYGGVDMNSSTAEVSLELIQQEAAKMRSSGLPRDSVNRQIAKMIKEDVITVDEFMFYDRYKRVGDGSNSFRGIVSGSRHGYRDPVFKEALSGLIKQKIGDGPTRSEAWIVQQPGQFRINFNDGRESSIIKNSDIRAEYERLNSKYGEQWAPAPPASQRGVQGIRPGRE